jgi:hypothetical protein
VASLSVSLAFNAHVSSIHRALSSKAYRIFIQYSHQHLSKS